MKIYNYTPKDTLLGERSIALGFFDGVHIGHRRLIERAVEEAKRLNIPSAIFTFYADASIPKSSAYRLYSTEEKLEIFDSLGVDEVILADFDTIKDTVPLEFINEILISRLGCRTAICGRDFRFGKNAGGTSDQLAKAMQALGRGAILESDVNLYGIKVSTTAIKDFLKAGEIEKANAMLGSPYFIKSEVLHGRGVGHTLGFPTVNTDLSGKEALLHRGVYFSVINIGNKVYPALTNIGSCPTFEKRSMHAETFILDFSGELYGDTVRISLLSFIRDEEKFESPEALIKQINLDIEKVKKEFDYGRKLD